MAEYATRRDQRASAGTTPFPESLSTATAFSTLISQNSRCNTLDVGLAGIEVYDLLRDEYDIQIEFGDLGNILAYLSIGDRPREIERLVSALGGNPPPVWQKPHGRSDDARNISNPEVAGFPAGGFLRRQRVAAAERDRGAHLQRICHVLSPRAFRFWRRARRITQDILDYIDICQRKRLHHDRAGRPGHRHA